MTYNEATTYATYAAEIPQSPAVEGATNRLLDTVKRADSIAEHLQNHLMRLLGPWPEACSDPAHPLPEAQAERLFSVAAMVDGRITRLSDLVARLERL